MDFKHYQEDIGRFLADTASEPTVVGSLLVRDQDGTEWVVLDSFVKHVDPFEGKGWRGLT